MPLPLPDYLKYDPEKRDVEPLGYAVPCPPGHKFDHLVFGDFESAEGQATDFANQVDADGWDVIPLFAGRAKSVAER